MTEPSRILVAVAEPHIRRILQFLLEVEGHEVHTAGDGKAAWLALAGFRPDLVLMDAELPGMGGLALLAAMRGRIDTAGVPVVMLTAGSQQEECMRVLAGGANDYIVKPFNQDELLLRVANLLRSTRTLRLINRLPIPPCVEATAARP